MQILFLIGLIVLNGLFAMSEIALVAAKTNRLKRLAEKHPAAKIALDLKHTPTRFLSTIQIGITAIGLLSGIVGEAVLSVPLAQQMVLWGIQADQANVFSTTIVIIGMTYFAIVVGELVPKRFAQSQAENIAVLVAWPIYWLSKLTRPFVILLSWSTEVVLKLLGQKHQHDVVTEDDIHAIVREGSESGVIEQGEQEMIRNILQLDDRLVSSMMTPRGKIAFIDIDQPVEQLIHSLRSIKHSTFPICQGNIDQIVGTLSAKVLLKQADQLSAQVVLSLCQTPVYIPESMRGLRLLSYFRESGIEMAFIVDEYGDIQGLVTLHDILEAIAGELSNDPTYRWATPQENGWIFDGLIPISELKNRLDLVHIEGEDKGLHTLNGLLTWHLGRLPEQGEMIDCQQWRFEVLMVEDNRVLSVKATSLET
ncbi:hemolysin family protein [Vibrio misgurnus]|uniref:hemolysin family protein n=1 Tax=Vibrio misgurnus TaxID=2993714 RepID=UPI0023F7AB4D|nr:hemolysin family protein [Vibrio sp. VCS]